MEKYVPHAERDPVPSRTIERHHEGSATRIQYAKHIRAAISLSRELHVGAASRSFRFRR